MAYRDTVLLDSPADFYEMETATGTDSGSGNRTLTLSNITTSVNGIITQGWSYNGTNSSASMATFPGGASVANMTFEAWVKAPSPQGWSNDYQTFVRRNGTDIILIRGRGSNITGGVQPGKAEVYLAGSTIYSTNRVDDGNWHHIVLTVAGTAAKLYVDGTLSGSVTTAKSTYNFGTATAYVGSDSGTGEFYKGSLDNVAIYTSALTAQKVTDHYNAAVVSGGYTAQAMTATALMTESRVQGRIQLAITDDTYLNTIGTNYGNSVTLASGRAWLFKLPTFTPSANETVTKVELVLTPTSSSTNDSLGVAPITSAWSETVVASETAPTSGSSQNRSGVNWTVSTPTAIDITAVATNPNGVQVSAADVSVHSAEATTDAYRPYVVYTVTPVAAVNPSAQPLVATAAMLGGAASISVSTSAQVFTASAAMAPGAASAIRNVSVATEPFLASAQAPGATVTVSSVVSAAPMTASASAPAGFANGERNVSVVSEPFLASAETPQGSGFAVPASVTANAFTASAVLVDASVATQLGVVINAQPLTATAVLKQPSAVNGQPIIIGEADDAYFRLVSNDAPSHWYRLNDFGSTALDRAGNLNGTYHGVQVGQFDAPDGRHSVHFNGLASIEQSEPSQDEITPATDTLRTTVEFSFRTTQANTFLMAGTDSINAKLATANSPAREISLKNGKISFKSYFFPNSQGFQQAPAEFSGFKNLADGEWHHVVIRGGTYRFGELGVEVWVDGKFEVRRVSANAFTGFPDWIGSRPSNIDGFELGALPSSQNFVGDMSEVVFYPHVGVDETRITRHFYAFMGYKPIEAQPMEAFGFATAGNAGRGNQKRALYLWWSPETDAYNIGGGGFSDKMNFDPLVGTAKGNVNGVYDYEGYKVFTRGVIQSPNGQPYRNEVTDAPSLIDLTRDVNLDDYDAIMFGDWPDEGSEIDLFESFEPGGRERIIRQLRAANDKGIGLMVTHPRLAVDLGIIDRVELVPTLRETKSASGQGAATGLYDYGSAYVFPWNIVGDAGLNSPAFIGSDQNGVPANRTPSFLADKAFYYGDTHKNDRYRVRALIEGLTDIPSYMIEEAVYFREYDLYGWNDVAYKYLHRMSGLNIGDEFIFHGSDLGKTYEAISADYTDARAGRWFGTYAAPLANVRAGTVVTTFGATQWLGQEQVANPYKDYATTIVLRKGDVLAGKPVVGKIFVNFSEQPNRHENAVAVQVLPANNADFPRNYRPDTAEQRAWEYSFTRKTLRSSQPSQTETVSVVGPNGQVLSVNISGAGSNLTMTRSSNIFPVEAKPSFQMVPRGLMWLQERTEVVPGSVQVAATPMTAIAVAPNPSVVAQRDATVKAQPLVALASMPKVKEDQTGDAEIHVLPMEAGATFSGFNKVVYAQPMTASAELVENFDAVHTSGEQIVLTLHGRDITLFLKEEV